MDQERGQWHVWVVTGDGYEVMMVLVTGTVTVWVTGTLETMLTGEALVVVGEKLILGESTDVVDVFVIGAATDVV